MPIKLNAKYLVALCFFFFFFFIFWSLEAYVILLQCKFGYTILAFINNIWHVCKFGKVLELFESMRSVTMQCTKNDQNQQTNRKKNLWKNSNRMSIMNVWHAFINFYSSSNWSFAMCSMWIKYSIGFCYFVVCFSFFLIFLTELNHSILCKNRKKNFFRHITFVDASITLFNQIHYIYVRTKCQLRPSKIQKKKEDRALKSLIIMIEWKEKNK